MRKIRLSLVLIILLLALAGPALAELGGHELPLAEGGLAYEINPDPQGLLWISDYSAGEIWRIDPAGGSAAVYAVGGGPSDAHHDGAGMLWWGDADIGEIKRMPVAGGNITSTTVTAASGFYGSGMDGSGRLWLTDITLPKLYSLDTQTDDQCTYTLPDLMTSDYLVASGDFVWMGDKANGRIARLQISTNDFITWNLDSGASPEGLALENPERLWWVDYYLEEVGVLDATAKTVTTYTLPVQGFPRMISLRQGLAWFSLENAGFGVLDPAAAEGTSRPVEPQPGKLFPDPGSCLKGTESVTGSANPVPLQTNWAEVVFPTLYRGGGWTIYELEAGAKPWGIAALEETWVVDQGRQKLVRTRQSYPVYLPMIQK